MFPAGSLQQEFLPFSLGAAFPGRRLSKENWRKSWFGQFYGCSTQMLDSEDARAGNVLFCFIWGLKQGSRVWERKRCVITIEAIASQGTIVCKCLIEYKWDCVCICVSWTSWQITPVYLGRVWALPDHILLCHCTSILDYIGVCVFHNYSLSLWSLSLEFHENFHMAVIQENIQTSQCGKCSACKASPPHVCIHVNTPPSLLLNFLWAVWRKVC